MHVTHGTKNGGCTSRNRSFKKGCGNRQRTTCNDCQPSQSGQAIYSFPRSCSYSANYFSVNPQPPIPMPQITTPPTSFPPTVLNVLFPRLTTPSQVTQQSAAIVCCSRRCAHTSSPTGKTLIKVWQNKSRRWQLRKHRRDYAHHPNVTKKKKTLHPQGKLPTKTAVYKMSKDHFNSHKQELPKFLDYGRIRFTHSPVCVLLL